VILVDGPAAARWLGLSPRTIRSWAFRFPAELPRQGTDASGRALYAWADVLAVDRVRRLVR
jgi:hypothetical protein